MSAPPSARFTLRPNPYAGARVARGIASLLLPTLGVGVVAWLGWLMGGDRVALYALWLLPVVSVVSVFRYQRWLAREDASVSELSVDGGTAVLRSATGEVRTLPRASLNVVACVYRTGGRAVIHLPCLELQERGQGTLGILVPDPGEKWPQSAGQCSVTPRFMIAAERWPQLLRAFEVPPTSSTVPGSSGASVVERE